MRQALYMNGNYEDNLQRIADVQAERPEQILFIQPHGNGPIADLRKNPPTMDDPVTMYSSISTDMGMVHFTGEVVGWDDKTKLSPQRHDEIDNVIRTWQVPEPGLFEVGINLLHIRRLVRVKPAFDIAKLVKTSNNEPLKPRKQPGGFSYVKPLRDDAGATN